MRIPASRSGLQKGPQKKTKFRLRTSQIYKNVKA